MGILMIWMLDDKYFRFKQFVEFRGISVNKLVEEFLIIVLIEFDVYNCFWLMVVWGSVIEGLKFLDKLDGLD